MFCKALEGTCEEVSCPTLEGLNPIPYCEKYCHEGIAEARCCGKFSPNVLPNFYCKPS
ncbi:hypothetical protein BUE80_DR006333 [Diplocarpon rosae]|nr:hypothetical protein BUE80_DR006333 [Diplocarpon rosae]